MAGDVRRQMSEHQFFSDAEEQEAAAASHPVVKAKAEKAAPGAKKRYIVFVGNLPYTATKEAIEELFAAHGTGAAAGRVLTAGCRAVERAAADRPGHGQVQGQRLCGV